MTAGSTAAYDVVVLGAGSGGENLAARLARRGLAVAVVEERLVGGECPFFACMPSKAVLHHAEAGHSWADTTRHRDEVVDHLDDQGHAEDLREAGVELIRGTGRFTSPGRVEVQTPDGSARELTAAHLVLATGASLPRLDVPGADDVEVWTSEDAWTSHELPARALVVGGGPVGTELATAWAAFGSDVVLVDRGEKVLHTEDIEIADAVAEGLTRRGVRLHLGAEVERLEAAPDGATHVHLTDGTSHEVDRVVACLGKTPRRRDVGLESLGVDPDDFEVGTDGRVTGAPNVWAIGDVSGHPPYTHAANALAAVIDHNLTAPDEQPRHLDLDAMPRCVFVDPPVGAVGTTAPDDPHVRVSINLANVARGSADGTQGGIAVLTARRSDRRLLGFAGVGPGMDEVVAVATLAVRQRLTVDDLTDLVVAFPTYAEVIPVLAGRARDALESNEPG